MDGVGTEGVGTEGVGTEGVRTEGVGTEGKALGSGSVANLRAALNLDAAEAAIEASGAEE